MPTPPPFGVGRVWLLRAPGVSSVPTRVMPHTTAAESRARQAQKPRWVAKAAAVTDAPGGWEGTDQAGPPAL